MVRQVGEGEVEPWSGPVRHASDYFDALYECALLLIRRGDAYVDTQSLSLSLRVTESLSLSLSLSLSRERVLFLLKDESAVYLFESLSLSAPREDTVFADSFGGR